VSGDGGDDANAIRDLAYAALKEQLKSAGSSELARQEGMKLGAQLASEVAAETNRAEVWDKVFARAEGMLNTFLDRMDAAELRKAAAASPPPAGDELDQGDGTELDPKAVLDAIGKRPPPQKAAELLKGAGVTAANLEDVLGHVRSAGQGWPAFLDQKPDWLNAVRAELGAPVVEPDASDATE
jgi:hypothetical protein